MRENLRNILRGDRLDEMIVKTSLGRSSTVLGLSVSRQRYEAHARSELLADQRGQFETVEIRYAGETRSAGLR